MSLTPEVCCHASFHPLIQRNRRALLRCLLLIYNVWEAGRTNYSYDLSHVLAGRESNPR